MKKKAYINPELHVVVLQHRTMLLSASDRTLKKVDTNLPEGSEIDVDDEEVGTGFWGR